MASVLGWYGPLIDLSRASSHIGDFVQLLLFVHRSVPLQSSKGGGLIRTDIHVGDDTRPYFGVSVWEKNMGSMISEGDVILLQSIEELVAGCRVGITTKDKLRKVIKWVQQSRFTISNINFYQRAEHLPKNWKVLEERRPTDCFSLSEVSQLTSSSKAIVCAFIGEIFLRVGTMILGETAKEKIFLSKRVNKTRDNNLVEDLICTGCQLCSSPMGSEFEQNAIPLSCSKSSNRLHAICSIYRPFMLYVWDESDYMPILVKNRAAEMLFGNIRAEKVYSSYRQQMLNQNHDRRDKCKSLQLEEKQLHVINLNFYQIWLVFLKTLLQQGKNSPLQFEITVDPSLDIENGKFEMVSASMPCYGTK